MSLKHFLLVPLCYIVFYFVGCSSGSYNVKNLPEGSDSTQITQRDTTNPPEPIKGKTFRVRTIPKFTLTLVGGINLGMAELSSNFSERVNPNEFYDGQNFGVRNGYGFYATGKVPLHKEGNVRLNITAGFNSFKSSFLSDATEQFGSAKYNVIIFGAGLENNFSPKYRVRPYIAAEVTGNMISGDVVLNYRNSANQLDSTVNVKIKNSFRIGFAVYSGLEYLISNNVGLNFGVRLSNSNLILKSSTDDASGNEISLRDKKLDNPIPYSGFKNFVYTAFYLGVNIYWGIKDVAFKF